MLKLLYSERFSREAAERGFSLNAIRDKLTTLEHAGVICSLVNTDDFSDDQLIKAYSEAVVASLLQKQRIRQVFGSRRNAALLFGRQVPALLVYDDRSGYPVDVYPHMHRAGRVEIMEYLEVRLGEQAVTPPIGADSDQL